MRICGLKFDRKEIRAHKRLCAPRGFSVPAYVDSRPYCLEASDQGPNPFCAGYATAGYIEVINWRRTHKAEQIDGAKIYAAAKKIDGDTDEGTTLESAVRGAIAIGLIPSTTKMQRIDTAEDVQFALHSHGVVLAGFSITEGWDHVDSRTGYIGDQAKVQGGHAVLLSWYQLANENYGWQNSWAGWGWRGFGRMTRKQFNEQFHYGLVLEWGGP